VSSCRVVAGSARSLELGGLVPPGRLEFVQRVWIGCLGPQTYWRNLKRRGRAFDLRARFGMQRGTVREKKRHYALLSAWKTRSRKLELFCSSGSCHGLRDLMR